MVHYVPFKEDLSDLAEKIEWLQNNDAVAERIARNAEAFVHKYLNRVSIACYMRSFIEQYSKLDISQDFPNGFCKDGPCKNKKGEKITELADEDLFRTGYWRTKDNKFRDVGYLYPPLDLTCPKEDL